MFQDSNNNQQSPNDERVFRSLDSIDKIEEMKKKEAEAKARLQEEREEYAKACAIIFASDNGKLVLKHLIKYCGVFLFDNNPPDGKLAEEKGKRKVYLEAIRPFIDKTTRMEVENYE